MVYQYSEVKVDGTAEGVEGVSGALEQISTFMQNCGWTLVDDRSSQPGSSNIETTHKYVFSSNGENGEYPTFFMTLTSGTSATVNSNLLGVTAHTAYDVGTNSIPASGARTTTGAATTMPNTITSLNVRSQDDNTEIYMAGDSEMVHLVTRREITNNSSVTMDSISFGRFDSFMSVEENPYPMLINGANGTGIVTAGTVSPRSIGGQPPRGFVNNSETTVLSTSPQSYADGVQPYSINSVDSIFFGYPMQVVYNDATSPGWKGAAGMVRGAWLGADATRLLNLSILTASGTFGEQTYRTFTHASTSTTPSLIVRKS
jgi:hypothetical protein